MEKEQIVKALECCVKTQSICDCEEMGCPALTKQGCQFYLRTDEDYEGVIFVELTKEALSLIREQEKRIEELETSCTELTQNLHACKAATVRKMRDLIEERCIKGGIYPVLVKNTINKVAEEMLEGGDEDEPAQP